MRQAGERGGHALDVPVSALAGLATAFAAFVAPAGLLGKHGHVLTPGR